MCFASTTIVRDHRRAGRPTCLLMTDHGIYTPLSDYFLCRNLSLSTERAYALAVKRLMNWSEAKHPHFKANGVQDSTLFASFLHDLTFGTIYEGEDSSGLWWKPHSPEVVKRSAGYIAEFSDWLACRGLGIAINPRNRPASAFEKMVAAKAFAHKRAASLLAHTKDRNASHLFSSMARQVSTPKKVPKTLSTPPAFPKDKIEELLWVGFRNEKYKDDPRLWKKYNLRDILITLLCLYGGTRVSEPMHLWLDDVRANQTNPESCTVLIHEPEHGQIEIDDPILGKKVKSRQEYLSTYFGGRQPLTRETGCRHSGWKGSLLDVPKQMAMQIHWIRPDIGPLFKEIWRLYIQQARPQSHHLPWAFLTKDSLPMGPSAYNASLRKAVEKIGLSFNKASGCTPHGLRHRYGQWLNELGINEKIGQICMHHANPLSQEVYRQPTLEDVAHAMSSATKQLPIPPIPLLTMETA